MTTATKTIKEAASDTFKNIQELVDRMAEEADADSRAKLADLIKVRMSDYSSQRFRAGQADARGAFTDREA